MYKLNIGLLGLLLITGAADARQADRAPAPPIEINAETSDSDLRSGISRFSDNVVITRGDMVVHADHGVIHQSEGRISRVELSGRPSTWRDVLEDGSELEGEAAEIHYDVPANVITLTGNARIRHARGEFTGHELIYDLTSESLAGRSEGDGRVRVIIEPDALPEDRVSGPRPGAENSSEHDPAEGDPEGDPDDDSAAEPPAGRD